jgi:hypothetical protein
MWHPQLRCLAALNLSTGQWEHCWYETAHFSLQTVASSFWLLHIGSFLAATRRDLTIIWSDREAASWAAQIEFRIAAARDRQRVGRFRELTASGSRRPSRDVEIIEIPATKASFDVSNCIRGPNGQQTFAADKP